MMREINFSCSAMITEENVLKLGFIKHLNFTYKMFLNNVYGYLDEIEVFFEPNEEINIIFKQQTFDSKDLDKNLIFIRKMKHIFELKLLIEVLSGVGLTDR